MSLQDHISRIRDRRQRDKARYDALDHETCMLCGAHGADKRSLIMRCGYDMQEAVPEMIDLALVDEMHDRGYYLLICKHCQGELLELMKQWRNEMLARRLIRKDHDGCELPEYEQDGDY